MKTCRIEGCSRGVFSKGLCSVHMPKKPIKRTPPKRAVGKKVKKKVKKKKVEKVSVWKKKFWPIFSQYIRLRDSDENGYCTCITCGKVRFWWNDDMSAGHFISRRHQNTLYEEKNVMAQCFIFCNKHQSGRQYEFCVALKEKFGQGICDELLAQSRIEKKFTVDELKAMYEHYLKEVIRLKREKNLL